MTPGRFLSMQSIIDNGWLRRLPGLASLAAVCTAIATLNLSGCRQVTSAGLASLAAGCTAITTLPLWVYWRRLVIVITYYRHGTGDLAAGCTAIAYLNLSGCNQITDSGLASLAAGCTGITTLNLGGCKQITDIGLASLAGRWIYCYHHSEHLSL